jgi:hypothetical protein
VAFLSDSWPVLRRWHIFPEQTTGAAFGAPQTQGAPAKDTAKDVSVSAQAAPTMTDVSRWTRRQWSAAKAKWAAEKDAWNGCQNEARTKKLSVRRSRQFFYDGVTKS